MFGVLRGASCAMKPEERDQWMNHICGVCLALREEGGQASRITTNYDSALISVLCEAQETTRLETAVSTCPLRGPRLRAEVVSPHSKGAQYGAALALTAGATKIDDHVADGDSALRYLPRISMKAADRWQEHGRRVAQKLGFDTQGIMTHVTKQASIEAELGRDFLFYSRPTELAMGNAFQHTAVIAHRPQNAPLLFEIGAMFGRIMYLLDAYQDYAEDKARQKFNGLAAGLAPESVKGEAQKIFKQAYAKIKTNFAQLDLPQPDLARKLLVTQLRQRGYNLLDIAKVSCASCNCQGAITPEADEASLGVLQMSARRARRIARRARGRGKSAGCCSTICDCMICCDCVTDCCCCGCCDFDICSCDEGGSCELCECSVCCCEAECCDGGCCCDCDC